MLIVASIQARLGSTRLPGKVLFPLGNRRIVQWVLDRTTWAKSIDRTFVAIGDQPENDAIIEYCKRKGIDYVVGPEENLLSRHRAVVDYTECDILVRITADCPFVPSEEIDRVIGEHLENEARYTTNVAEKMPIGTAVDIIEPDLLEDFDARNETHPVKLGRANPDRWGTVVTSNPDWRELSEVHMAIDTPADYWELSDAFDAVGDNPHAIAEWLIKNQ